MRQALVLLRVRQLRQNVISRSKAGLVQALGVFIDTIVIWSCTAMIMLLAPEEKVAGLSGMDLLQTAMEHHLGRFGVVFIAATLFFVQLLDIPWNFILCKKQCGISFRRDNWISQTAYKIIALFMLFYRWPCSLYFCMGPWRCGNRSDDNIQYHYSVSAG